MNVFDYPQSHLPPSYESRSESAIWEYLSGMWASHEQPPRPDPSYRVDVVSGTCVVIIRDGQEQVLFS